MKHSSWQIRQPERQSCKAVTYGSTASHQPPARSRDYRHRWRIPACSHSDEHTWLSLLHTRQCLGSREKGKDIKENIALWSRGCVSKCPVERASWWESTNDSIWWIQEHWTHSIILQNNIFFCSVLTLSPSARIFTSDIIFTVSANVWGLLWK